MDNRLAARTGFARADDALHLEAARHVFQLFSHIFAQGAQVATAATAFITRRQFFIFPLQVVRQRLAAVFALRLGIISLLRRWRCLGLCFRRFHDLGVFLEIEVQLIQAF